MKAIHFILAGALALQFVSCGSSNKGGQEADSTQIAADTVQEAIVEVDHSANEELIKAAYGQFVFAADEANPRDYFTDNALKKLAEAYDYDCETGDCYGFWELRSGAQDGPEDTSYVTAVEPLEDGWYAVVYKDMGIEGVTNIKIVDGKIDDYKNVK